MSENVTIIKCPKCGETIDVTSILSSQLEEEYKQKLAAELSEEKKKIAEQELQLNKAKEEQDSIIQKLVAEKQKAMEASIRKSVEEEQAEQLKLLKEDNAEKLKKIQDLAKTRAELDKLKAEVAEKQEVAEMEFQEKLLEERKKIKEEVEKRAMDKAELMIKQKEQQLLEDREALNNEISKKVNEETEKIKTQEQLKYAELQKQLEDQKKLVDEMKRKAEQGSMQTQGEVQEIALENLLRDLYKFDTIEEVAKGVKGADCIQSVMNHGKSCGKIIYESKRTKAFAGDWPVKLKENMLSAKADICVLVTQAYPAGMNRFGLHEGVWVCSFEEVKSVSLILRESLIHISAAIDSQENKGDKMVMLYDYLTGNEFSQQVSAIVDGFESIRDGLNKEKKAMMKIWAEREKQIEKVISNTVSMYGSVRGIAGTAIKEIKQLELPAKEDAAEESVDNSDE